MEEFIPQKIIVKILCRCKDWIYSRIQNCGQNRSYLAVENIICWINFIFPILYKTLRYRNSTWFVNKIVLKIVEPLKLINEPENDVEIVLNGSRGELDRFSHENKDLLKIFKSDFSSRKRPWIAYIMSEKCRF